MLPPTPTLTPTRIPRRFLPAPFGGAGRLPFWVDLIFKSAFQKNRRPPLTGVHRNWTNALFLESTFIDQNNPKRQTAGPHWGASELGLLGLAYHDARRPRHRWGSASRLPLAVAGADPRRRPTTGAARLDCHYASVPRPMPSAHNATEPRA